ncbi:hypothetical protein [Scytonema sp. HK-05]|uniref:hypothetical protein n=1 Tax=Scytonema sp. HK-05 TaxID=1137095 RepID=UPI000A4FA50D|nr:hypothetical protein [Scytonema sp. HK-05]
MLCDRVYAGTSCHRTHPRILLFDEAMSALDNTGYCQSKLGAATGDSNRDRIY